MKQLLRNILIIAGVVFMCWFILSWLDVLAHNDPFSGDYKYHFWNMFLLFVRK